jgi:hypothetical protein
MVSYATCSVLRPVDGCGEVWRLLRCLHGPGRVAPGGARCRPAGAASGGCARRSPSENAPGAARSTTRLEFARARANSRLGQSRGQNGRPTRRFAAGPCCVAGGTFRGATPLCGAAPRTARGDGERGGSLRMRRCASRPPRAPVGPGAHKGTAPAMAGQAAQRGYEAPRERGRGSSRAYVSGSRGCPSLELARSRANSRRVPSRGAACPAIAGLPAAKRRDAVPARRGPPARGVAAARSPFAQGGERRRSGLTT